MANDRFTFFRSYYEALDGLSPKAQLEFLKAVIAFGLDGVEPQGLTKNTAAMFKLVRPVLTAKNHGGQPGNKNNPYGRKGRPKEGDNETKKNEENESETKKNEENESETKKNEENELQEYGSWNMDHGTWNMDHGSGDGSGNPKGETSSLTPAPAIDVFSEIQNLWNDTLGDRLPKVAKLSEKRRQKIRVRMAEWGKTPDESLAKAREIFTHIGRCDFLLGGNASGWTATFDWLFDSPNNWVKVVEGNYDNDRSKVPRKTGGNRAPTMDEVLEQNRQTMRELGEVFSNTDKETFKQLTYNESTGNDNGDTESD